jgi:zinc protease
VIEREAASSVDAQLTPFADPSLLRLAVTAARGHTADEILAVIDQELASMAEQPPAGAEVEKAKAIAETDFWTSLVDVDGKAEALGHHESALGDFRKVNALAGRLAQVTVEDVARVVRMYLRPERRTIVIAEPEHDGDDADEVDDTGEEST